MEEETKRKAKKEDSRNGFDSFSEDIVEKILRKLPALSLASAACVCKSWYHNSNRILSRPKLASAISLNPSLDIALQEVVDKVLSESIRPHFAIASGFGNKLGLEKRKFGSRTPLIVTWANGIMGRDAVTNEDDSSNYDGDGDGDDEHMEINSGFLLTVGFVPGLKVDVIPYLRKIRPAPMEMIDIFVMDIRNYTTSASGCTSPVGIIMFASEDFDLKPIMEKLDYAMSKETIIVGDERTKFLYRSRIDSTNPFAKAIALVFAKDREKPHGLGEIQFHAALSNGVSAIGPRYKTASAREAFHDRNTWLTARQEGQPEILDGQRILNDINDELENRIGDTDLYIGVTELRKRRIRKEKPRLMSSLSFYGVMGGDEEYLFVHGIGIRTADYFQFYHSDPSAALSSCRNVSANLRNLRLDWSCKKYLYPTDGANEFKKECIGGFIFSCCGRGEAFFGSPNVDSSPFLENFPGVPLAGIFCGGEIGRSFSISNTLDDREESTPSRCLHVFSSVYLVLSYTPSPAPMEQ
ncbi:conserved hypothetical protein [Ricinus communis]|uniref:F-box domain-containing protein n=1 Tax=Ricinus communis TaxID=3988 RepID=B9RAD4_RICCO|nr:conserved hypothetical protein [Ricinus communis]